MTFTKNQWKQRIRKEFDEPAKDVIQSFARNGYSKRLTAGAIEIATQTLLAYCRRENIVFADRINVREECKTSPKGKAVIGRRIFNHCPYQYSDEYLLSILRGYSPRITVDMYRALCEFPHSRTFIRRFGSWRKAKKLAHKEI